MVEICDTILYSRCGNPKTDVILTVSTTPLQHSGYKLLKSAQNKLTFKEISRIFLSTFQKIRILSVSGHCMHLIFKICPTVAGVSMMSQFLNLIFGGFFQFCPTVCHHTLPASGGLLFYWGWSSNSEATKKLLLSSFSFFMVG